MTNQGWRMQVLDIKKNRLAVKYSKKELLARLLWGLVQPFFRFSPRICFGFRATLLRLFGAKIGAQVHIYNSAVITMPWNLEIGAWSSIGEAVLVYNLGRITIGSRATISHRAHLCAGTHDYTLAELPLHKPPITIGDQSWICADSFIGPGVAVGEGAVVGARAVAVHDIPPWTVVGGNPARPLKKRSIRTEGRGEQ